MVRNLGQLGRVATALVMGDRHHQLDHRDRDRGRGRDRDRDRDRDSHRDRERGRVNHRDSREDMPLSRYVYIISLSRTCDILYSNK